MKLTIIIKAREKIEIENVSMFSYNGTTQELEYWIGETALYTLTEILAVKAEA